MLHENHLIFTTPVLPLPCKSCIIMTSLFTLVVCVYCDGFTKEDKVVMKFLRETKRYGAKRFLSEFPKKPWSLSGLKRLIKKIELN